MADIFVVEMNDGEMVHYHHPFFSDLDVAASVCDALNAQERANEIPDGLWVVRQQELNTETDIRYVPQFKVEVSRFLMDESGELVPVADRVYSYNQSPSMQIVLEGTKVPETLKDDMSNHELGWLYSTYGATAGEALQKARVLVTELNEQLPHAQNESMPSPF